MSIAIYDNFDNSVGEFPHYDTYDAAQRTQLARQKHVDIRSFIPVTENRAFTMFDLDGETMTFMDGETMLELESGFSLQPNEAWTAGTTGAQSDRNHFYGISLTCAIGATSTQSVMTNLIDISSFSGSDYISLALPAFPTGSLTLSSTYLDLSSDGLTTACSLPFSSATLIANGSDYEARFPISLVTGINLAKINAVRFRITATGSCTFRCLAIRAIASTWEFAPVDQNTLYGFLGATVPPSGGLSQSHTFPTASGGVTPSNWPILLRSDGGIGPSIVDTDIGVSIHAGSGTAQNTLNFYLRERPMTWTNMTAMNGMTMAQLASLGQMPDWTPGTLNVFSQAKYILVSLKWGIVNQLILTDNISGQTFTYTVPALTSGLDYYVHVELEDDSLRVRIYAADYAGDINWNTLVFDSTAIVGSFNRRRPGRLGWYTDVEDGNCWVRQLRPRRVVYSEYRSAALPSITPVIGAQIYASATPGMELAGTPTAYRNAILSPDVSKSQSGHCWSIKCTGAMLQGVQVGAGLVNGAPVPMTFTNLFDSFINFDMLSPQASQFVALLRGDTRIIVLFQTVFQPNVWTHVDIPLEQVGENFIPGDYYLYLVQASSSANTFFIDNLSVSAQTISWQGRTPAPDPWGLNDTPWIKYGDQINSPYDGAVLGRGNTLQVRGQMVDQSGFIDRVKILPRYATLGNFVWADQEPNYGTPPTAVIASLSTSGLTVSCKGNGAFGSVFPNGVGQYLWEFGDGTFAYGGTASHIYALAGTYTLTLTAIDAYGQKNTLTRSVTITVNTVSIHAIAAVIDAIGPAPVVGGSGSPAPPAAQINATAPIPGLYKPGISLATVPTPVVKIALSPPAAVRNANAPAPTIAFVPIPAAKVQPKGSIPVPKLAFVGVAANRQASVRTPTLAFNFTTPTLTADANAHAPTLTII